MQSLVRTAVSIIGLVLLSAGASAGPVTAMMAQRAAALQRAWRASGHTIPAAGNPKVIAGKVLTPAVNVQIAPAQASVSLTMAQGTVGISVIGVTMVSPSGLQEISTFSEQPIYPQKQKETLSIQMISPFGTGLTLYSEPGAWSVSEIVLITNAGDNIQYSGSQLAGLFGDNTTVQVTNDGTPDNEPPRFGAGKILTPTVSLSSPMPIVALRLAVHDKTSGVKFIAIEFEAPGNSFFDEAASSLLAPVTTASVDTYTELQAGEPTGTYTLTGINICDVAMNCVFDTNPSDIQKTFGTTTFTVTN